MKESIDKISDLFQRGFIVPSEDFNVVRQPDGRMRVYLRKAAPVAPPAATTPDCTCDDLLGFLLKVEDNPGDFLKSWCLRAIEFDFDGATVSNLIAYQISSAPGANDMGNGDLTCDLSDWNPFSWWFTPAADKVNGALSAMSVPPTDRSHLHVTMYLNCDRPMLNHRTAGTGHDMPTGDETTSRIEVITICYRSI